jgi:hypothetical protein
VTRSGLVRVLLLSSAIVCALIGVRLVPSISTPDTLGPRPAVIVNDTTGAVLVAHCDQTCPAGGRSLAPAQELRAGPPGARWRIEDASGVSLGCLTATGVGERLLVSHAVPCPS